MSTVSVLSPAGATTVNAPFASARKEAITRSPRFSRTTPLTGLGSHVALSIGSTGHVGPARTVPLTRPDDVAADVDDDDGVVDVDRDVAEPQPARRMTTAGRTAIERIPTLTFTPCALVPSVRGRHPSHTVRCETGGMRRTCCLAVIFAPVAGNGVHQFRRVAPDSAVATAVYRQHVSPRHVDHRTRDTDDHNTARAPRHSRRRTAELNADNVERRPGAVRCDPSIQHATGRDCRSTGRVGLRGPRGRGCGFGPTFYAGQPGLSGVEPGDVGDEVGSGLGVERDGAGGADGDGDEVGDVLAGGGDVEI